MFNYYTAVILMCWMALSILSLLIWENDRMARSDKQLLYLTYALIMLSSLAEWCGVRLDGNPRVPVWVLLAVKCADFTLTPLAGGALALQMRLRPPWRWALIGILSFNTLYQLVAAFTGWMVTVPLPSSKPSISLISASRSSPSSSAITGNMLRSMISVMKIAKAFFMILSSCFAFVTTAVPRYWSSSFLVSD